VTLFLGFDGVLHREPCLSADGVERCPVVERWLRRHAQIDVVIGSSWRDGVPILGSLPMTSRGTSARVAPA
jgi:hypothetical protein